MERDPERFAPLFVLAPARSCSSLAAAILGQHPNLYGFPELRLFRAERLQDLLVSERAEGLVRAVAELHEGTQTRGAAERAIRWLQQRRDQPVTVVLDHLLARIAPLIGVEKSPETSRTDAALQRADAAYPRARYIHLVRHPWSTVRSMVEAWSGLASWSVPPRKAPAYCLAVWCEQHRRIAAFRASAPGRCRLVRAEDLAGRPREVLPELCRWLGVHSGEAAVQEMLRPEQSPFAWAGPPNARGGLDPKFLASPRRRSVTLPPAPIPADWSVARTLVREAIELARKLGYDTS
jgi:Sulfotransferase family